MVSTLSGSVTCPRPMGPIRMPASRKAAILGIFSRVKMTPRAPAANRLIPISCTSEGMAPPAAHAAGDSAVSIMSRVACFKRLATWKF